MDRVIGHLVRGQYLKRIDDLRVSFGPHGLEVRKILTQRLVKSSVKLNVPPSVPSEEIISRLLPKHGALEASLGLGRGQCHSFVNVSKEMQDQEAVFQFNNSTGTIDVRDSEGNPLIKTTSFTLLSNIDDKWTSAYQDFVKSRRKWWKRLPFDPAIINVAEENARGALPRVSLWSDLTFIKGLGMSSKLDLESVRVLDVDQVPEGLKRRVHMLESVSDMTTATFTFLLDSVRKRMYHHKSSTRLALHNQLAPWQVCFYVDKYGVDDDNEQLDLFKTYLQSLLEQEQVMVWNVQQVEHTFEEADTLGIPYVVILSPQSLENGVVKIRDRETTWCEQIHAAHLTQRMVYTFQERLVEDTWTQIKNRQQHLKEDKPKSKEKKSKETKKKLSKKKNQPII